MKLKTLGRFQVHSLSPDPLFWEGVGKPKTQEHLTSVPKKIQEVTYSASFLHAIEDKRMTYLESGTLHLHVELWEVKNTVACSISNIVVLWDWRLLKA